MTVPLIEVADLYGPLGRTSLSASETIKAEYYIDTISAFIASKCDLICFEEIDDDVVRFQADYYGIVELTQGPITSVSEVNAITGESVAYAYDGRTQISGLAPFQVVDVTYSHGTDAIPDDLKGIVTEAVAASIGTQTSGPLKVRTVGDVTYTFQEGQSIVANLSAGVIDGYRTTEYSWRMGAHTASDSTRPINWFQVGG